MTQLLPRSLASVRDWDWQYGVHDLEAVGLQLTAGQREVLESDEPREVMAAWPVPDPASWVASYPEQSIYPLTVYTTPAGPGRRPTIPVLAVTDPRFREAVHYGDPVSTRFPSVIARITMPDLFYEASSPATYLRIWDVEPVDDIDGTIDIVQAPEQWWRYSAYASLREYWATYAGDIDDCMLAVKHGREHASHTHRAQHALPYLFKCIDGEEEYGELQKHLFWHGDPQHGVRAEGFTPELHWNDGVIAEMVWEDLAEASQVAAETALRVVPPWQVDALRLLEQQGGRPWW